MALSTKQTLRSERRRVSSSASKSLSAPPFAARAGVCAHRLRATTWRAGPQSASPRCQLLRAHAPARPGWGSGKARAAAAREEVSEAPETFVDDGSNTLRSRWERTIRRGQDDVCAALERVDGCKFHEDTWLRDGGGGGITRVLQDGNVFEKAGVNVSVVYGTMPPDAYRAAVGEENVSKKEASVPFFAAGISSVVHPRNPMAPTMHFNYRYFETDPPPEVEGAPQAWWFGGGTDLTPSYLYDEDAKHFHQVYKDVCDRHDPEFYPRFKKWADDYYYIECASLTQDISMTSLHTILADRLGRLNVMNAGIAASDVVLEEYSSTT